MTGQDVRKLTTEEIDLEVKRLRADLYKFRTQAVTEKVENTGVFLSTRRDIARLLTEKSARTKATSGAANGSAQAASTGATSGAKSGAKKPAAKAGASGAKKAGGARASAAKGTGKAAGKATAGTK